MAQGGKSHLLTRQDIIDLMNKWDHEVLYQLNRTSFGFEKFLKRQRYILSNKRIDYELFENLMEISGRACSTGKFKSQSVVREFVSMLADCDSFLFDDTFQVLDECIEGKRFINNLPLFVKHYVIILKTIMKGDLPCCQKIVDYAFPALQNILNVMKSRRMIILDEITQEYKGLKRQIDRHERPSPASDDQDDEAVALFRKLSIMPVENDVVNVVIGELPCNKIDGPYRSVDHYLSVHFRLTREDMLRSFRDCIKIVTNPNDAYKLGCNLYDCVRIISSPEYTPEGICFKINITTLKDVEWANKNVLLSGSIVCLTPDNFHTVIFATVKEIKSNVGKSTSAHGKIELVGLRAEKLKKEVNYLMIEPNAYFECYKHVLTAIKLFSKDDFPLADFLVFFDFENPTPKYLMPQTDSTTECCPIATKPTQTTNPEYCLYENVDDDDFYKLFLPASDIPSDTEMSTDITQTSIDKLLEGKKDLPSGKSFNPLNYSEWPTAKELKLDDKQHEAFITALTNKVAVIQGPPGTGKTFIGVKVVKALLLNAPKDPIIVCCLTNHALDQFLERIYMFNKNVVRLGSQSKSTVLEANTIDNLLCACREYKKHSSIKRFKLEGTLGKSLNHLEKFVPEILQYSSDDNYDAFYCALRTICKNLQRLHFDFHSCKYNYIEDSALNKIIDSDMKVQLRSKSSTDSKTLSASVMEWLNCSRSNVLLETCEKKFGAYQKQSSKSFDDMGKPNNVWHIDLENRYQLLYKWRIKCLEVLEKDIADAEKEYEEQKELYSGRMPDLVKLEILKKARVIGVTTTGAGKFRSLLQECYPKILIIEEAAEVLESHTIASLLPSTEHLILIGDHMQLRPLPADHELGEVYNLKISMFERLITNNCPSETLVAQHRMKPYIADLLVQEELYSDLTSYENVFKYEDIKGVKTSMFFFNHSNSESEMCSSTSASNSFEAAMIVSFAQYLCQQNYTSDQITIIATYAAQITLIQSYLEEEKLDVHVTTVDNYQGEENDIVLVSFVRNNSLGTIGFLKENNRVCVALSRARKGLFCFGNFTLYANKSKLWKSIIEKVEANDMIGDKLPLQCSRHGKEIYVDSPDQVLDFSKHGCDEKCGFKLACTHTCQRKCHCDDPDHLKYRCPLPCEKFMKEGKKCPRMCYERCKKEKKEIVILDCGHPTRPRPDGTLAPCLQEVQKCLPCKHIDTVPCNTDLSKYKCKASVPVPLPCGHLKNRECYKGKDVKFVKCDKEKPVIGPCGHTISIPCSLNCFDKRELLPYCKNSCGSLLKCGHPCVGSCHWCLDSGIHALCLEACTEVLNCGHVCGGLCGSPCPPCEKQCSMSCYHETGSCQSGDCLVPSDGLCIHVLKKKRCINQCARPCNRCEAQCERRCKHGICSKKCYEECSIPPCPHVCKVKLFCGHICLGLCGDPCPFPCLKCNEEDSELNLDADRFVQLIDCQHIIELDRLNEHIEMCLECFMWPSCPACCQPIQNSLRYKTHLRRAHDNVVAASDSSEEISHVNYLWHSMYGTDYIIPAEFREVNKKISKILLGDKPSSGTLLVLKHCLMSLSELMSLNKNLDEISDHFVKYRFENLLMWICHHLERASYQQLDELKTSIEVLKTY